MEKIQNGESGKSVRLKLNELIDCEARVIELEVVANNNAGDINSLKVQITKCSDDIAEIGNKATNTELVVNSNSERITELEGRVSEIENQITNIAQQMQYGLRNGDAIVLSGGESKQYIPANNSLLYALIIPEQCRVSIGSKANAGDLGVAENKGVVQLGFLGGEIYLTAYNDIELIPIIYKF